MYCGTGYGPQIDHVIHFCTFLTLFPPHTNINNLSKCKMALQKIQDSGVKEMDALESFQELI